MLVSLVSAILAALPWPGGSSCASPTVSDDPGYVLHEWGTFTTLAGSDGVLLEGLVYDDHQLPAFVRQRATSAAGFDGVRCKMETPVLYFYSDRERELRVKVAFQQGILTQWYPEVHELYPPAAEGAPLLRGGLLDWGKITVLAPGDGLNRLPAVGPALHWEHAREVDANVVLRRTPQDQHERFLFYRGLGSFALPLCTWSDGEGALCLSNAGDEPLAGAIVLVRDGRSLRARRLEPLAHGTPAQLRPRELPEIALDELMALTARLLEEQGLYPKEARAMVNTWRESYFETDGLRVLYPLPRAQTDWLLPLSASPAPRECVRVLVGRLDVLTVEAEQAALASVARMRTPEEAEQRLGRFALPLLARLGMLAASDAEREHVHALAQALLERSF